MGATEDALEELNKAIEKKELDEQTKICESITNPLYHYTSAEGLKGIIEKKHFYMTDYLHMNDPGEVAFGIKIVKKILGELKESDNEFYKALCTSADCQFSNERLGNLFCYYITSFSRHPNDLMQWRLYGGNGCGFSLGVAPEWFSSPEINIGDDRSDEITFTRDMIYVDDSVDDAAYKDIRKKICDYIELFNKNLEKTKSLTNEVCLEIVNRLIAQLLWISLRIKHKAYEQEQEVRLICFKKKDSSKSRIKIRTRAGALVPYIEHQLDTQKSGNIKKIFIGPAASEFAKDSVVSLLESNNVPILNEMIEKSVLPYRVTQ
jgi:hypothetical protein